MRREERRGGPQVGTAKRRCSRRIEREERRNHSRRKGGNSLAMSLLSSKENQKPRRE